MAIRMTLVPVRYSFDLVQGKLIARPPENAYRNIRIPIGAMRAKVIPIAFRNELRSPSPSNQRQPFCLDTMTRSRRQLNSSVVALVLYCSFGGVRAQENPARLDSVIRQLDRTAEDTIQLALLISACQSWYTSNNAFPYMQRLDSLSDQLLKSDDAAVRERAVHARGAFHFFTGYHAKFARNIPLALRSFNAAIEEFSSINSLPALAETYDALGILFRAVGDHDQAFAAFQNERHIARAIDRPHITTQSFVHLAACAADHGNFLSASLFLDSCNARNPADSSAVLNERARIATLNGNAADVILLLHESLAIAKRSTNPWDQLPVLAPLARAHYAMDQNSDGLMSALECEHIGKEMGDQTAYCTCMALVGEGELRAGEPRKAERKWLDALELARAIGNAGSARELGDEGSVLHIAALLGKLYRQQGRVAEALKMSDIWVAAQAELQRMNGRDEMLLMSFRKEQLIDSLEHANATEREALLHSEKFQRERSRTILLLAFAILIVVIALVLWSRSRLLARSNAAILAAQQQLVESEKAREADVVRTRIASDIHDQLGSDLTKLVMLSDEVDTNKANEASTTEATSAIKRVARDATRSLSDIVWAVDPAQDDLSSLVERMRSHSLYMLEGTAIEHTIDCMQTGDPQRIEPATKRDIQLIHREALNNAVKHAKATRIDVLFHSSSDHITMRITDNGVGLDKTVGTNGNGLRNMQRRAERVGGTMKLESTESGTSLLFELSTR